MTASGAHTSAIAIHLPFCETGLPLLCDTSLPCTLPPFQVVMAATNLPELLDSALTRPGRFDRQASVLGGGAQVTCRLFSPASSSAGMCRAGAHHLLSNDVPFHVPHAALCTAVPLPLPNPLRFSPAQVAVTLPDVKGRQQILDLYLTGKPVAADVDTGQLRHGRLAPRALHAVLKRQHTILHTASPHAQPLSCRAPLIVRRWPDADCRLCRPPCCPQTSWPGAPPASAALSWPTW